MAHDFELTDSVDSVREWRHRANRLRVLVSPTPVAPVVSFGVVYNVGSRHEGAGHTGATHLLEHLMFKGTERFNRDRGTEIARVLQRVGAAFNATTWLDRTNYYETVPIEHLELAVDIEADRMRGARVRPVDLDSERTVVLNELERGENEPFEVLMKASFAQAFLEHPYHHPTIGWRSDVESVSAEVLRRFYDTYYHPDNATVIVTGEIDEANVLELLEQRFGAVPQAPMPVPEVHAREGVQRGERRFVLHRAAEVGALAMTWHIPAGLHPDLPALSVLSQVLSEGVTSRLYQRLVETNRCLGVHAFPMELHDPGALLVFATLAPGVPHAEVEAVLREEIAALVRARPGDDEMSRAKVQVRTDLAFHRESPAQILAGLTEAVAMGDWRRFLGELEAVSAVSGDDVSRVAAEHLHDRNLTVGWLVPEDGDGAMATDPDPGPQPCFLSRPVAERVALRDLPGGGRLAVLPNPYAPTVTIAGSLRAGRAMVAEGRFGVAGLAAAMLDRGTAGHDRLSLAREIEDHGLQLGIDTSGSLPTVITMSVQGLAEQLPRMAGLLAEVLREPSFATDQLEILREQILGGLAREREETFSQGFAALTRLLYPAGHPHHRRTVAARREELLGITREDLVAFHARTYSPESLMLAVVGAVETREVQDALAAAFDGWQASGPPTPTWPTVGVPKGTEERVRIADRPNLDAFLGRAGRLRRGDPDYPAAIVANSCLGQSTLTSRLGAEVRDRAGLTYGIYSRFFGTLELAGPWSVFLSVSPDGLDRAIELCRNVIARYWTDGPEADELEDERQALAGSYRVSLATNAGVARELVTTLSAGEPVESLDRYPDELLAVSREQVMEAIRRHLHPDGLVVTAAGSL
jgi:zinc protease